jgi:DNA polymerase elongation subunit (family B)
MEPLNHYLFIDIETASCVAEHEHLSPGMQREWETKSRTKYGDGLDPAEAFWTKSGIFAEFGKIVCISIGCLQQMEAGWKLYLRSFAGNDEKELLQDFCVALSKFHKKYPAMAFVGHNIIEFDLPYISRRMIINGMSLPQCMNFQGKKPWEVKDRVKDTMQIWSFGDYKSFTKLSLLAEVLGIPTPKDDISGEDVTRVYWQEQNLQRIVTYCQKDVETTARVFMRLMCYDEVDFTAQVLQEKLAVA